jgi:hypothetical protein
VYRFDDDNVAGLGADWLRPDHKSTLSQFLNGDESVEYEGFADEVVKEQALVDEVRSVTSGMTPQKMWSGGSIALLHPNPFM